MSNLGSKLVFVFFLHILISMKEMTVEVKKMAFCLHLTLKKDKQQRMDRCILTSDFYL